MAGAYCHVGYKEHSISVSSLGLDHNVGHLVMKF